MTEIRNLLIYKNKITQVDNIIYIINRISHGIECGYPARKRQYHESHLDAGMVLEILKGKRDSEQSGNLLYLLHMSTRAHGLCLAISDGVVDPGGHVIPG